MRLLVLTLLAACGSESRKPAKETLPAQSVRDGVEVLCSSSWNGERYGTELRSRLPDDLRAAISNEEVQRLVVALTSPDAKRVEMFDGFLEENSLGELTACPFRDRLATWPRDLPIKPPPNR